MRLKLIQILQDLEVEHLMIGIDNAGWTYWLNQKHD